MRACVVHSDQVRVRVDADVLERGFTGFSPNPACVGDTVRLFAYGSGVWVTDGEGVFTDTLDPEGAYIPAAADAGQSVQLCWVVRSQDLSRCRTPGTDTLCLTLTVTPSTAQGSFTMPPGSDTLCAGGLTEPLGATITNGTGGFWTTDGAGTFLPSDRDPNARYSSAPGDAGRWIHLTWNVTERCGRVTYTDSLYVEPGQAYAIQGPNQICANSSLVLRASPAGGADSLLWFRGDASAVVAAGPPSRSHPAYVGEGPQYSPGALPPGDTAFTLCGFTGGCQSYSSLRIAVLPAPQAAFEATPHITTMNNPTITFTNQSQGATSYVWNFGDPNQPDVDSTLNPTFSYSAPGTYTVVLLARNDQGCADFYVCTNCIQVLPRKVFLPSAFSPNGDGKNDVFRPLPIEERFYFTRLEVYDRWGQMVFAADNLPAWDGRASDGRPLDPGTYSYRAVILLPNEGPITHTGIVHLVR
ncbi:MAG: PKD domain-containing protein [Bacteroidetes bacterium]|nr:MAG: PKD domain-containing protein [Bacteroidota bacterium]